MTIKVNAVLLAAGFGSRLRPITGEIPKPLAPVCNRPLLEIILQNLKDAGIDRIALNSHYLPEKINEFVKSSRFSDSVEIFHEPEILGTGGPLVNAKNLLSENEIFILHNGDILTDIDLRLLIEAHMKSGGIATMALLDGPENKVRVSEDGCVIDILDRLEAPPLTSRKFTYAGIMALSREIFKYLPEKPENCSIIKAVTKAIDCDPGSVKTYLPEKPYWNDLGTIRQYFKAHEDVLLKKIAPLAGLEIPESGELVGENSVVSDKAETSGFLCAGNNCTIEDGAFVCKCVLLDGAVVRKGEFRYNEIIAPGFSRHRDFHTLKNLKCLRDFDLPECRISSLVEQGSDRGFFRISDEERSVVLMHSSEMDDDFQRYVDIGRFLAGLKLQTPEIFHADTDEYCVLMEDLGNDTLYKATGNGSDAMEFGELYLKTVEALVEFQTRAHRAWKDSGIEIRLFNYDYLRWETSYFQKNFLENYCGFSTGEIQALDAELNALAECVFNHPRIFMHRDFQSQNILIQNGGVRFVDFQGARIGPVAYDIMSLLKDPYVYISLELEDRLLGRYFELLEKEGIFEWRDDRNILSVTAGLQRNMQALGAYTFLAMKKGKTEYLRFIPRGLECLRDGLKEFGGLTTAFSLERLSDICGRIDLEKVRKRNSIQV